MVAKMPLLISSRMMSAGLTPRSSASSLTVMVPGSSIAPRSRGSSVCTPDPGKAPSLRGGLRGPRRPRVPLLLLATDSSFDDRVRVGDAPGQRVAQVGRERGRQRPAQGALGDGFVEALGGPAHIGAAAGCATRGVEDDLAGGGPHDAHQLTLRTDRPAGDAGPTRDSPWGDSPRRPAYDATSPDGTAVFFDARFGLAAGAASGPGVSGAAASPGSLASALIGMASGAAAAFFVTRLGLTAGASPLSVASASAAAGRVAAAARFGFATVATRASGSAAATGGSGA